MKVFQIWYDSNSKSKIQYPFIPYDNSNPDKPNEFEYGVMRKIYKDETLWKNKKEKIGVVSWKFKEKTKVDPERFHGWLKKNKGFDVYHINPFSYMTNQFENVWKQGEHFHNGMLSVVSDLFEKVGFDPNILETPHTHKTTCFCNYWVANKRFWDLYMSYTEKLYNYIYENKELHDLMFHIKADQIINSGMFSFIFERMFSTVLAEHVNEFKVLNYK